MTLLHHPTVHEVASEAGKALPPVSVVGLHFAGVGLSDWVLLATLIYTVLQAGLLIWNKIIMPIRQHRKSK